MDVASLCIKCQSVNDWTSVVKKQHSTKGILVLPAVQTSRDFSLPPRSIRELHSSEVFLTDFSGLTFGPILSRNLGKELQLHAAY